MQLRRVNVLDGAMDLLDAEGLDGLTMRKLGAALNVQGGALYRHFPSKEALLDAIAERLLAGVGEPLPDAPWPRRLTELGERLRAALLTRRDGARVVSGTFVSGPNTRAAGDSAIEILCTAGFAPPQAGWITFALFYFVLGHTIEEQAQSRLQEADDWAARLAAAKPESSAAVDQAMRSLATADPGERFDYGLRVFIDGVIHQLDAGRGSGGGENGGAGGNRLLGEGRR